MVPLIGGNQNNHIHRAWWVPGAGGGKEEELLFHVGFQFYKVRIFWRSTAY